LDELVGHQREAGGDAPTAPGHPHRALGGEAADPGTSERAAGATCEIIRRPGGDDGAIPERAAATGWPAVSDRWRHRDDAHLPRRPRAPGLRGLRSAEDTPGKGRPRKVLPCLRRDRPALPRRLDPGKSDLAGEPRLGKASRLLIRNPGPRELQGD